MTYLQFLSSRTSYRSGDAKPLSEDDFDLSFQSVYYYTGKEIRPAVYFLALTEGMDYEVTYANNVNAGRATVTITGIGAYRGTITKQFTIHKEVQSIKASVADTTMEIGKSQKISVSGTYGEVTYEDFPKGIVSISKVIRSQRLPSRRRKRKLRKSM